MNADKFFYWIELCTESNQYQTEIEASQKISALSESKVESNQNRFDLTALLYSVMFLDEFQQKKIHNSTFICEINLYSTSKTFRK
jgi:hypothetical protein